MLLRSWLSGWRHQAIHLLRRGIDSRKSRRRSVSHQPGAEVLEGRCLLTTFDLSNLGAGGITLVGHDELDEVGTSVASAGDVNGDGFDDFFISANFASGPGNVRLHAGESYIVFGGPSLPTTLDLFNLGSAGVTIFGVRVNDRSGNAIAGVGDVNGDGFDDVLIGAEKNYGPTNTELFIGESYVLFGGATLPTTIDLANLGSDGITILGADEFDNSGHSVSGAGDVNGDGFDDVLVGAWTAYGPNNSRGSAGESYVIFGGSTLPAVIDLANLGSAGTTIFGVDVDDNSGRSVSGAGDVNGDGFDDVIIGATSAAGAGNARTGSGESYIVFGKASLPETIDLATLGTAGVSIFGAEAGDYSGRSVSGAGDVNGDGFADVLVGAFRADGPSNTRSAAGEAYLIFGGMSLPASIDLASLGTAGVTIFGVDAGDQLGKTVAGAGDINGDGFDDMILGAQYAAASGNAKTLAGEAYVIFGGSALPATIDLASPGVDQVTFLGIDSGDRTGFSVSSAGDVNGDGFDDLLIGAESGDGDANATSDAGETYLVYGSNEVTHSVTHPGTTASEVLTGNAAANVMVGGLGDDTLVSNGGADVLYGGNDDDVLAISDLTFRRLDGGNGSDTLRFDGSGLNLNLTTLSDEKVRNIEVIDVRGSGANTLTLNVHEVLALTANSNLAHTGNTLIVRRNADDTVNIGPGWTSAGIETIKVEKYEVFTQGEATLKITARLLELGGGDVTWVKKQTAVDVLPQVKVSDGFNLGGGTLNVGVDVVRTNRKVLDQFTMDQANRLGAVTGPTVVNGHLSLQITLFQNTTGSDVQAFLRGITFSTKGKGLKIPTRTLDVTLTATGLQAPSVTIHQNIHVKKKP